MLAVCFNLCSLSIWCCYVVCPSFGQVAPEIWSCHRRGFVQSCQKWNTHHWDAEE